MEINWIFLTLFIFLPLFSLIETAFRGAPFAPTPKSVIRKALKLANLKPGETLYDLGCGTGKVLIIGEKEFGAKVIGFEISPLLFFISKLNFFLNGTKGKIYFQDFFSANLKRANVIFLYLTPKLLLKLEKKLFKELTPGTRIVCYSSPLPSKKPTQIIPLSEMKNKINLYLYQL